MPARISRIQTVALLTSAQWTTLDRHFSALQAGYKMGAVKEEALRDAFRAFYTTDPELAAKYDAWITAYPRSYVARLARGIYYKRVGMDRRGRAYIGATSNTQIAGMQAAFVKAEADLQASAALDDKPVLSYAHAIDIAAYEGDPDGVRELLDRALQVDPNDMVAREKFIAFLAPRWGGDLSKMHAFIAESARAGLSPARLNQLTGEILSEQAHMAEEEHDYPTAEQDYRQALALGDSSCANCFAGLLLNEEKFTQAIPVLSQALDDDPDDTGMRANRAHAYLTTGKFHEALADLAIGADEGDAYSQGELGRLNMQGIPGVLEPDPQTGIEWLKKSAAQGNEAAIHNLQIAQQMIGYAAKPQ